MLTEAIIGGLGSLANGMFNAYSTDVANARNMELANYGARVNYYMWELNNRYNSPQAQMARLQAAGLNPNLVYGNGAVGNSSSQPSSYQAPRVNPSNPFSGVADIGQNMMLGANVDLAKEQAELTRYNQDVAHQQALEYAAKVAQTWENVSKTRTENEILDRTKEYTIRAQEQQVKKIESDIRKNNLQSDLYDLEKRLYPLKEKLSSAQYANIVQNTKRAIWELEMEQQGKFVGHDFMSTLGNQIIRWANDQPSMFDSVGKIKDKLVNEVPKRWYESKEAYYKRKSKGSGTR